jgi:hypothetical protein
LADASPAQVFVAYMDRALTLLFFGLAVAGGIRRLRQGHWDLPAILLVISPLPLLPANGYGGEMGFRVFFFTLPFLSFFLALLFYPSLTAGRSWRTTLLTLAVSLVLLTCFVFSYYGKERQYYFTPQELEANQYIDSVAPEGALLMNGSWGWPLQYKNYELYDYFALTETTRNERLELLADPEGIIWERMASYPAAYLIISRSQKARVDMTGVMPAGALDDIEQRLLQSPSFQVLYSNEDARVFVLAGSDRGVNP